MIQVSYIIGTSIAAVLVLAAIGFAIALRREDEPGLALGTGIVAPLVIIGLWVGVTFPPFDMDYHRYDTVTGTVASVEKRLVSEGDSGMSEKYVVQLEDDTQQYGCLDTRCANVKTGETIELSCLRVWAWYGSDGFDCEFITANGRT